MKTVLANGITKLEKLRSDAFHARESLSNEFDSWSEEKSAIKEADKIQSSFEKFYFSLAAKFKELGECATEYTQWETISPLEFMEEVNN